MTGIDWRQDLSVAPAEQNGVSAVAEGYGGTRDIQGRVARYCIMTGIDWRQDLFMAPAEQKGDGHPPPTFSKKKKVLVIYCAGSVVLGRAFLFVKFSTGHANAPAEQNGVSAVAEGYGGTRDIQGRVARYCMMIGIDWRQDLFVAPAEQNVEGHPPPIGDSALRAAMPSAGSPPAAWWESSTA